MLKTSVDEQVRGGPEPDVTPGGRPRFDVGRLIAAATARPWAVAAAGLALALISLAFTATHFSINSDPDALLSPDLAYRKAETAFARLFPQSDANVVVVIDGATPELAEEAAAGLSARLAGAPAVFRSVRRPDGGPFWAREGLLFASTADVKSSMDQLIAAEPFLGPMAADPSLRGLMDSLTTALKGVSAGQTSLASLDAPIRSLGDALEAQAAGRRAVFSWQTMISGRTAAEPRRLRKLILVDPKLNFGDLKSGSRAIQTIRDDAQGLGLDAAHGVRVRLTGPAPLRDEELGTLGERALPIGLVAVSAIVLMLWLATRSPKVILAILATTLIGLASAAALGLLIFHAFNIISIAFIPLFVGLGIDFGIQLSVRYRFEHLPGGDRRAALIRAGEAMGRPLVLAASAIAAGFLAFAPTAYRGVSQLGIIAGLGMLIALALSLTVLPALILILKPVPAPRGPPARGITRIDAIILGRRRRVVGAAAAAALASAAMLPLLSFDFNPLHLRSPKTESVSTLLDLFHDPDFSTHTLETVRPSLAAAQALAARARRLPEVSGARTLADFVPADQGPKLAAIADASTLLDLTINPIVAAPPPTDAEAASSLAAAALELRRVAVGDGPTADHARRLASALEKLAAGPPNMRAKATTLLITPLGTMLDQIRAALAAQPVTLASLPPDITRDWVTADGRYRVSMSPRGDANQNAVLVRFIDAVGKIAPDATGDPIDIREGGRTVVAAFIEAGVLSFVAITGLLFLVLRRARDVAITMAPIVLTGLLTLGSCVVIGQPLNFANIIALPLLFGIGVAFHISFVMSWRSGGAHLLTSSLARAVFFSALTTATGFGSLWLSSHPGTASMGMLLMISLVWTLVSALIFQPALMGSPPATETSAQGRSPAG